MTMTQDKRPRRHFLRLKGNAIEVFGRNLNLPASRLARVGLGLGFVLGGLLAFLPVFGLWMLPLGLLILSIDFVIVRRWRRRWSVHWERRQRRREEDAILAARQAKGDEAPVEQRPRLPEA